MGALGRVLGEVADALQVGGNADGHHDLAQVARHGLALGDGQDRLFLDLVFQHVDAFVVLDDPVGQRGVAARQRVDGIVELLLDKAAHLGQHAS